MRRTTIFAAAAAVFAAASTLAGSTDAALPTIERAVGQGAVLAQWPGQSGSGYYPRPEWEGRREHCEQMRGRLREIRYRMQYAPPWERERLGTRFYEIRERLQQECWGHWRED